MLTLNDIMTREVFVLNAKQSMAEVRNLMNVEHLRHVPIVDDSGFFVGLLTHRDLLAQTVSILADISKQEQYALDRGIPIQNVMKTGVVTAAPDTDLRAAIEILLHNKYGCLPVVANKKLVGIVTEADFLKLTYKLLKSAADV